MDQQGLLAAIIDARPGPADVVYVERRGEDYSLPGDAARRRICSSAGWAAEFPDVWIYWSGEWPADDADRQQAIFKDLLEEMESMGGGAADRCRWSLDDPWAAFRSSNTDRLLTPGRRRIGRGAARTL